MREQKKIGHPGTKSTQRCVICAIIQPNLYKQRFGLLRSNTDVHHSCSHILRSFRSIAGWGRERKAQIRRKHRRQSAVAMRSETRRNVAASVRQFANSRHVCSAKIYETPEIFHYRFSWTSRPPHTVLGRNICPHVPHNTSRVCATRVRANSLDLNSSHVRVINAITYKLWRELEPHDDLSRVFAFSASPTLSLFFLSFSIHLFIHLQPFLSRETTEMRWPVAG